MYAAHQRRQRRIFQWPDEAKILANSYVESVRNGKKRKSAAGLTNKIVVLTGNPRDACIRFLDRHGARQKRTYQPWTKPEQQRVIDLVETCPIAEIARMIQRTPCAIRSMLRRLGESPKRGREWFTVYSLAEALHVRAHEVQRWVNNGWLQCRIVESAGIKKQIVDPDDFCEFARKYGPKIVGRRLTYEGLKFVRNFIFPPKHAHLLPLRKPQDRGQPEEPAEATENETRAREG